MNLSRSTQISETLLDECKAIHARWNELTKIWTLPVVHALGLQQPARFNDLRRRIEGISATSLSERLAELQKQGIIQRKVLSSTPPRVEYSLTTRGKDLLGVLDEFANWVSRWEAT